MDLPFDACYRAIETRDARFDGRLFVGVRTTGIYCRPICPARRPKPENVRFFQSAAAAEEAGFRACLRCRPEVAPDLGAWNGTSNTVARALALIEAGALDGGDVESLAARLGVGERHLRRLFRQHLGAAPITVAQTRRVLLAKQLLHETSLPMADVALAAGFGSVRRFNETFQALYRRPPAMIRRRRKTPSADPTGSVSLSLPVKPPFDWDGLLAHFAARSVAGIECVAEGVYARSFAIGEGLGSFSIVPVAGDRLQVRVKTTSLSILPNVLARIRRLCDLTADPAPIAAHLKRDPILKPLVEQHEGLRVPGGWSPFELAVRAVFGQQVTVAAATGLVGELVRRFGAPMPEEVSMHGVDRLFPEPGEIARADLSVLPMPKARSATAVTLAQALVAGPSLLEPGRALECIHSDLTALPGIGDWTANYIAMRQLRSPDAFPASDVALLRAVERLTGERPTAAALATRAEAWRPWRAYAAQVLWRAGPTLTLNPSKDRP
ncbi:MAG: DNA-3-methyladenine glycosylase 2 family protein [Pseudomonadota bacterium]